MWYTVKIGPVVRESNGLRTPPIRSIRPPEWLGLPEIFFENSNYHDNYVNILCLKFHK